MSRLPCVRELKVRPESSSDEAERGCAEIALRAWRRAASVVAAGQFRKGRQFFVSRDNGYRAFIDAFTFKFRIKRNREFG
jgi:hypothetical protein